jgi:hypothetical protein
MMYSYTAVSVHLHFIWNVNPFDDESETFGKCDKGKAEVKSTCPVYHREFVHKYGQVCSVKPAVLRQMYRDLTGDMSAPANLTEQQVDERLKQALELEDPDLIWDQRLRNDG